MEKRQKNIWLSRGGFIVMLLVTLACSKQEEINYELRTSYFKNIVPEISADSIITCVTYNIHHGFVPSKDPWDKDVTGAGMDQVKNIADIIRAIDPDIVALQEVQRNRHNALVKDFIEALASELNMNYAFGAHGYNDPYYVNPTLGEWGTGILTKFKIESIKNLEFEYVSVWERRSMLDAQVRVNDSTVIHATSLHFLPSQEGIDNAASYLSTLSEPAIFMGDYNYTGPLSEFNAHGYTDIDSTYNQHAIDRIFINRSLFSVKDLGVIPDSYLVSDHPANYGVLKMIQ